MFGFGKVKVNIKALAFIMDGESNKEIYSILSIKQDTITISGRYFDKGKTNNILKVVVRKNKVFFEDAFGSLITHVKQGVEQSNTLKQIKEIYSII